MTSSTIETVEAPSNIKTPPKNLSHRICPCQFRLERQQTRCGQFCGPGPGRKVSETPPFDMCIVCHHMAVDQVPCRHCGKTASL